MRRVVSIFLTNFRTDRLRAEQGRGRGTVPADGPLVTAALENGAQIITGLSPEAAAAGLRVGFTVTQAHVLVGGLTVVPADPEADTATLRRLALACLRYAPLVAPDPPDGVFVETTGCAHLHGGEAAMLADLRARVMQAGFSARVAVADQPGAAHALARFGADPVIVLTGSPQRALARLPAAALRLPQDLLHALRRVGLEQVGQIAVLPRGPLARRYGRLPLLRLDQAFGAVAEPIHPLPPPAPLAHRLAFSEPLLTTDSFVAAIGLLADAICGRLEKAGQGARRLDLLFERVDGAWQAIRIGTARSNRDAPHLARLLAARLDSVDPGLGVEAMRLAVTLAEKLTWTQRAIGGPDNAQAAGAGGRAGVAELVDRLAGRLGSAHVYRTGLAESHVPERSVRRLPPLAPPTRRRWLSALPRPARLFDPPLPVDATSLLPDDPPIFFVWRRVRHRIRRADGPERVFGEWWTRAAEAVAVRDYFAVEDDAGNRFWLYRRGDGVHPQTGDLRWFLHGRF